MDLNFKSNECYDATIIPINTEHQNYFKSAGILICRFEKYTNEVEVLIGVEYRDRGYRLNVIGGKKDFKENPQETASREFWEEIGKLKELKMIKSLLLSNSEQCRRWYLGFGKYVLYIVYDKFNHFKDLPNEYKSLKNKDHTAEHLHLVWVKWDSLCKNNNVWIEEHQMSYEVSQFLSKILKVKKISDSIAFVPIKSSNVCIRNENNVLYERKKIDEYNKNNYEYFNNSSRSGGGSINNNNKYDYNG